MIVNCVGYKNGIKQKNLGFHEISNFLTEENGIVWLALKEPDREELLKAQEIFQLHSLAVEDCLHGGQRPKVEEYGDAIFISAHTFEVINDEFVLGEVYLLGGPRYVVSIRKNYSRGFSDVRDRCEREPHLLKIGPGFIVYTIVDSVVDQYFPIVEKLEDELEKLEEKIFSQAEPAHNIESLYSLKQKILKVRHANGALLDAMGKLHGGRVPTICVNAQEYYRDVVDHLYRVSSAIENAREMLTTAIQVNLTMISLSDSKVSKRLASWAAILAVPTMVAGIYGMNFKNMPEIEWEHGYYLSLFLMIGIDLYLYYRFKKARWL